MALPRHIKYIFLLPVQDLRKDNVFKEIWQKSLKFPRFFCICLRKHFACEKALLIWNLLLPWFKRKNTLKFLCMSKSQSPDWARPICWALCKWYKLEAWRNLGWSHRLLNSQVLRALPGKLSGVGWLNWLGTGQIFLGIPANIRLPTTPWDLTESAKPRNSTTSCPNFSCSKSFKLSCNCCSHSCSHGLSCLPPVQDALHSYPHLTV